MDTHVQTHGTTVFRIGVDDFLTIFEHGKSINISQALGRNIRAHYVNTSLQNITLF